MLDIDWDRKPVRTEEEKKFDELCKKYEQIFGEPFGYVIVCAPPLEVAIKEVEECIAKNQRQKKGKLKENCVY